MKNKQKKENKKEKEEKEIIILPPPNCEIIINTANSVLDKSTVNIKLKIKGHNSTFYYHLFGKQEYNEKDKMKKNENFILLSTIESYECENNDNIEVNISFFLFYILKNLIILLSIIYLFIW